MESYSRWLVVAISQGSSAWATATIDTWDGCGQSAQSRDCVSSIRSRRCGGEDGSRSCAGACQGREESGTVESSCPLEPRRSSGTCPEQGEAFRGGTEGNGRYGGSRGRVLAACIEESSTSSPRAPISQPVVRVQKVYRAFRASFGEDRCGTRRVGSPQRGTQSSDPSRSPSRSVATRHPSTTYSRCLHRVGRIEGSTERERDEALSAPACKRQAMSRSAVVVPGTHLQFPIRSFLPICQLRWTIAPTELFEAISIGDQVRTTLIAKR